MGVSKNHRFLALNCHGPNLISGLRNVSPQNLIMKKKSNQITRFRKNSLQSYVDRISIFLFYTFAPLKCRLYIGCKLASQYSYQSTFK